MFARACFTFLAAVSVSAADPLPADHAERMTRGLATFEKSIKPLLVENCVNCHGGEKTKAELNIITRENLLKGGADGIVVVPFKPSESRLLKLVRHEEEPHMPDKKPKLADADIAKLTSWIEDGAPYEGPLLDGHETAKPPGTISHADRDWWAFQPLKKTQPPHLKSIAHPIDRFILAKAQSKNLTLSALAEKRTLVRRLYLDQLGIPPTPEQINRFVSDTSPDAWSRLIDDTLASPRFGERWARHWLDVARFAESSGFEHDYDREGAYQFRDFVIRAFNLDMPFNQFLKWQLAGDEFAPDNALALAATGFLGAGVFPTQITANEVERTRYDAMDDMLSTTSLAFMGLTVGCARCHDHKFDPFPARDYYKMLSTFTTTTRAILDLDVEPEKTAILKARWEKDHAPIAKKLATYETALRPRFEKWLATDWVRTFYTTPVPYPSAKPQAPLHQLTETEKDKAFALWKRHNPRWQTFANALAESERKRPTGLKKTLVCAEGFKPLRMHTQGADFFNETYFLRRGNTDLKNGVASQDFLQVLLREPVDANRWRITPPKEAKFSGRRAAMANWLTDVEYGAGAQVARVAVNRLWQHHFGQPLVATPNDFGHAGALPTHPELLDFLAAELLRNNWQLKPIHKLILTSATYQQSTAADPAKAAADPDNQLFVRRLPRRLEGEALRDSILSVSGMLDPKMYGPGTKDEKSKRRSIYFTVKRSELVNSMVVFDLPEPLVSQAIRPTTTVAPQALFLMNAPQVRDWAAAFARRLADEKTPEAKIKRAYALALGRAPTSAELAQSSAFIQSGEEGLTDFCQVLFSLNEFAYEN